MQLIRRISFVFFFASSLSLWASSDHIAPGALWDPLGDDCELRALLYSNPAYYAQMAPAEAAVLAAEGSSSLPIIYVRLPPEAAAIADDVTRAAGGDRAAKKVALERALLESFGFRPSGDTMPAPAEASEARAVDVAATEVQEADLTNLYLFKVRLLAYLDVLIEGGNGEHKAGFAQQVLQGLGLRIQDRGGLEIDFEGAVGLGIAQMIYLDHFALAYLASFEKLKALNFIAKAPVRDHGIAIRIDLKELTESWGPEAFYGQSVSLNTIKNDLSLAPASEANFWREWRGLIRGQAHSEREAFNSLVAAFHPDTELWARGMTLPGGASELADGFDFGPEAISRRVWVLFELSKQGYFFAPSIAGRRARPDLSNWILRIGATAATASAMAQMLQRPE